MTGSRTILASALGGTLGRFARIGDVAPDLLGPPQIGGRSGMPVPETELVGEPRDHSCCRHAPTGPSWMIAISVSAPGDIVASRIARPLIGVQESANRFAILQSHAYYKVAESEKKPLFDNSDDGEFKRSGLNLCNLNIMDVWQQWKYGPIAQRGVERGRKRANEPNGPRTARERSQWSGSMQRERSQSCQNGGPARCERWARNANEANLHESFTISRTRGGFTVNCMDETPGLAARVCAATTIKKSGGLGALYCF